MKKTKLSKRSLIYFLISGIVIISLFSGISRTKASTTEYLQWQGTHQGVGGYLVITDFPAFLEIGKTYKITATFTVEELDYADAIEFGRIEWALQTGPDEYYTIGYSFMDINLTKHEQNSTISHWGLPKKPTTGGGRLTAIATIKLHNSTEPDETIQSIEIIPAPTIIFRVESDLRIRTGEFRNVRQGSTISLIGTLKADQGKKITVNNETTSAFYKTIIELIFTNPNGQRVTKSTNTDLFGNFTCEFTANATGKWFVTAYYNGSDYFSPSTSNIAIINVIPPRPIAPLVVLIILLIVVLTPWIAREHTKEILKNTEQL